MLPAYREFAPPPGLEGLVACLWEHEPDDACVVRVIPDGCLDLIWLDERELVIAGADTGPRSVPLAAGVRHSGIRLRPGAAGTVLGVPATELRDVEVPVREIWPAGGRVEEAIATASGQFRLELLAAAVSARNAAPDLLVAAAAHELAAAGARVGEVAGRLGVSERQLHRRVLASVGYGPKMLARVARLRRLVALPAEELVARALAAGYASQAHMNEEVRRLTGTTPVRFLKDATPTAA